MINALLWAPARRSASSASSCRKRLGRLVGDRGRGGDAGDRRDHGLRLRQRRRPGSRTRSTRPGSPASASTTASASTALNLFLRAADRGALGRRDRLRRVPRAGAPAALLLPDAGGGDGDARLVPLPGPAALRPLLRPDAGAVLLPLRRLGRRPHGRRRPDGAAGDAEDDDLHADRLAADAGRRDRHGDHLRPRRPPHLLDRSDPAPGPAARQPALDLLVLRRRLPGEDARLPRPRLDAGRLPGGAAAGAGRLLRGAGEGRRLRVPAGGAAALPGRRRRSSRR